MKTIRAKILSSIILITTVSLLITGGAASVMNYQSTVSTLQQTLQEARVIAAHPGEAAAGESRSDCRQPGFC